MVMVVGEAPGGEEDAQGVPFVGPAGQTLDNLLGEAGLSRSDMYVTNTILCRPTQIGQGEKRKNRSPPAPAEVANCKNRLISEILYIDPLVILALGKTAICALMGRTVSVEKMRGEVVDITIRTRKDIEVKYPVLTTYHPSYLMQYAKENEIFLALKDFRLLKDLVYGYIENRKEKE